MVPEFEKAAFGLKNKGDMSGIIKTSYGFHIIKLLDKRGIPPFGEKKAELKQMISRDSRNEASRLSMVTKIKTAYKYKRNSKDKRRVHQQLRQQRIGRRLGTYKSR
ncbi:MAG: peptidylprolyl isomerase [Bacteroidetes bacterium]|nr:peptidylprolyl isomerase [Bacteroidota bacterium]